MTAIKLYGATGACSLAAHILLNELGVQYDPIVFKVEDGIPQELWKLNPKAKVPVLVIDGEVITENVAILTAIAQLAPERHLLGSTDLEKLRTYEYLGYLASTMHGQAYGGLFRPGRYTDDEALLPSIREKSKHTIQACYEYIEAGLKGVHAVGNQLTVVDPYLYVFWRWGSVYSPGMQTRYPKYAALVQELGKLESVQRTVKEEGIEGFFGEKSSL